MRRVFHAPAVEALRRKRKLTYRALAALADCTELTAMSWAKGRQQPLANQLAALADALEVSMDDLFRKRKTEGRKRR